MSGVNPRTDVAVMLFVLALAGVVALVAFLRAAHLHRDCEPIGEGYNGIPIYRCPRDAGGTP